MADKKKPRVTSFSFDDSGMGTAANKRGKPVPKPVAAKNANKSSTPTKNVPFTVDVKGMRSGLKKVRKDVLQLGINK